MSNTAFFYEIDTFKLKDDQSYELWVEKIVAHYDKDLEAVNYIFMSDDQLLEVNRSYLDHDYYTDIISFPMSYEPIQGDIFISIDRVLDHAAEYDVSFHDELLRVMAHGLLHFMGYNDHTDAEKEEMRKQEENCINLWVGIN